MTTVLVFVTKYALSAGIEEVRAEVTDNGYAYRNGWRQQYSPGDWHRTRAGAVKAAEAMRAKKIASLKKQIAKLEKLTFSGEPVSP
jgi:hypothetical protein